MNARRRAFGPYPAPAPVRWQTNGTSGGGWEFALTGDLSDKQSDLLSRLVDVPPKSRGTIFFDSGGGSVYAGLALATVIRLRGLDAAGVVAGECSSAALLPFAACRRRFVTPHSSLLFHPIRWSSEEDVRYEEAVEWARHFALLEKDMDGLLARLFDMPRDKLETWTRPGRFVSGSELVENGLATMVDLFAGDLWTQMGR
jgi:ATP-dependent protease ClpP protease subunit